MDDSVKIHAGASVSGECTVEGDVTIHSRSVVHPKAVIVAEPGNPIVIGSGNIIEEASSITSLSGAVTIGNGNHLQVGCRLDSCKLGDANIIEPSCKLCQTFSQHCEA